MAPDTKEGLNNVQMNLPCCSLWALLCAVLSLKGAPNVHPQIKDTRLFPFWSA